MTEDKTPLMSVAAGPALAVVASRCCTGGYTAGLLAFAPRPRLRRDRAAPPGASCADCRRMRTLRVLPLGGLGEIGKNMTVL